MGTRTRSFARRATTAVAGFALAVAPAVGLGVAAAPAAVADAPADSDQAARFEVDFLQGMIEHHAMAVMMSQMCLDKVVHGELASTCGSIIATQQAQIGLMQGWLQDWYGIEHEPDMSGMQSMQRLEKLTGAEFEIAFLRSMIRHHWGAVRESDACLARAEHDELLTLCQDMLTAQLGEIEQMQAWLGQWYGLPGGRPTRTA